MAKETFSRSQKKALLVIGAILLAIRFGVVPLIDYQNQLKQQIELESRQLERAMTLLSGDEDAVSIQAISSDLAAAEALLPVYTAESEFKLVQQQRLEQLASDVDVSIEVFDWLGRVERGNLNDYLFTYQGQIEVEGAITDIVRFQTESVQELYSLNWQEMTLRAGNKTAKRGDLRVPIVSVTLFFNVSGVAPTPIQENQQARQ